MLSSDVIGKLSSSESTMKGLRLAIAMSSLLFLSGATEGDRVDLLLVLAIDASGSTINGAFEMQIAGHALALRDSRVMEAIGTGPRRRIGISAIVWSDDAVQWRCLPWTVIANPADAAVAAEGISRQCRFIGGTTAIGGALRDAVNQLNGARLQADRRIIDLSANEPSNEGAIEPYRADALKQGIVINGLVLEPNGPDGDAPQKFEALMRHFREEVIGGPGSFALTATREAYVEALVRKLIGEISGGREGV